MTPNANAERVDLVIPQPKASEVYYNSCAAIDKHNRCRQDDLMLETKFVTHNWSRRVNMPLLGIGIVDAWFAFQGSIGGTMCDIKQWDFYEYLSEELIEDTLDVRTGPRRGFTGEEETAGRPGSGIGPHLTPTKRKRNNPDGTDSRYSLQGRCMECRKHGTTSVCSECRKTS